MYGETISEKNINILRENVENLSEEFWVALSSNPSPLAIEFLRENYNKIVWCFLAENPSPEAIKMYNESNHPDAIYLKSRNYKAKEDTNMNKYLIGSNYCTYWHNYIAEKWDYYIKKNGGSSM